MKKIISYSLVGMAGYLLGFYEMKYKSTKALLNVLVEKELKNKELEKELEESKTKNEVKEEEA